jgi:thioredoxin-like negative regulator of GroEL
MKQEHFEKMIGRAPLEDGELIPKYIVVYFTANWWGPCRSVRPDALEKGLPMVTWLKCDIDQNDYTAGYCGVRSIPTFLVIKDMAIKGKFSSTQTDVILENVYALLDSPPMSMGDASKLVLHDDK